MPKKRPTLAITADETDVQVMTGGAKNGRSFTLDDNTLQNRGFTVGRTGIQSTLKASPAAQRREARATWSIKSIDELRCAALSFLCSALCFLFALRCC